MRWRSCMTNTTRLLPLILVICNCAAFAQWKFSQESNPIDEIKTVTASLESDSDEGATLIIRYRGTKAEAYVATRHVVEDEFPVRISFVDEKPAVQRSARSA